VTQSLHRQEQRKDIADK